MKTVFESGARNELLERVELLTPESRGRWGSMTSAQAVTHLTDCAKMAFGEIHIKPRGGPLSLWPVKKFIIYVAPFPNGAPTAPELIARSAANWDDEVAALRAELKRFESRDVTLASEHPAFGKLSAKDWGALVYKHTDHHLRQFGV